MAPSLALIGCLCLVVTLFYADHQWRPKTSAALWIPLVWALIIASRPVSSWLYESLPVGDTEADGSPVDRLFYQAEIFAGLVVLFSRRFRWSSFFYQNKWLVLYFAFLGISVLWSDYTFVAFKRWIKEVGHIVMVLVVLTEPTPMVALKALAIRCSYVLLPLSVVFVKYFPDLGRYYDRWTGHAYYCGVATNKNMLGMTLAALGVSLFWALMELSDEPMTSRYRRVQYSVYFSLLITNAWLLSITDSATAIISTLIGGGAILLFRYKWVQKRIKSLIVLLTFALLIGYMFDAKDVFISAAGRDATLTGRTEIWDAVLAEDTNPLIGTGFYSFWMGDRVERLSQKYFYLLNEAHNGYLEIYLTGGFVALLLYLLMLLSATRLYLVRLAVGDIAGGLSFRFAFLIITILYTFSESVVSRMNIIWFLFLLTIVSYQYTPPRTVSQMR